MKANYNQLPKSVIKAKNREIVVFSLEGENIDQNVVKSFGEEWDKFHDFHEEDLQTGGSEYFDIMNETMLNKNSYMLDIGCGSGRWTKYLLDRAGFIEAIAPSVTALLAADHLLGKADNVRLSVASVDLIPFADETFDFAMSVGVLHHLPDTQRAIIDFVKKVKWGGHFYVYLYYNLDNRGILFKFIFKAVNGIRLVVSSLPSGGKKLFVTSLPFSCICQSCAWADYLAQFT